MTDGVGTTKPGTAVALRQPHTYHGESIREVRARAATVPQDTTPEERDGLKRLNQILGQDRPLRDNVPRGYYLNIEV